MRRFLLLLSAAALLAPLAARAQTFPFSVGGLTTDVAYGVAYTPDGELFVTGSFTGQACFDPAGGGSCLTSAGGSDGFLAAYNQIGDLLFVHRFGGPGDDRGLDIAYHEGRIYIAGEFKATAEFTQTSTGGTILVTSNGGLDAFVAAWDVFINPVTSVAYLDTVVPFGSTADDTAQDLAVCDPCTLGAAAAGGGSAAILVTGGFTGSTNFNPAGPAFTMSSAGQRDVFVAAYAAASLTLDVAIRVGHTRDDVGYGIDADPTGRAYVTGAFERKPDFDPGPGNRRVQSYGLKDAFVAVYDFGFISPAFVRVFHLGGAADDSGNDIASAGDGRVFLTGTFAGNAALAPNGGAIAGSVGGDDAFIGAYTTASPPTLLWAHPLGGPGADGGNGVDLDECLDPVFTGAFTGTVDFDRSGAVANRVSAGAADAYITGYTDAGALRFANRIGGTAGDVGYDVAVRPSGESVGVGAFRRTASLTDVPFPLASAGEADGYVVLYNVNGRRIVSMCTAPPPDMVGWWNFDARAPIPGPPNTFFDLAVPAANNGTPQGPSWALTPGPVVPWTGQPSVAIALDAMGDRVRVPVQGTLALGMNDLTIDAWVMPAPGAGPGEVIAVVSNVVTPFGAGYEFVLKSNGSPNQWVPSLYYEDDAGNGDLISGSAFILPPGQWSHVTATLERHVLSPPQSSRVQFFLNVWQQTYQSVANPVGQVSTAGPLYIGRNQITSGTRTQFAIDEVEVFHRALSSGDPWASGEIRSIYFNGKCMPCWTAQYQLGGVNGGDGDIDAAAPEPASSAAAPAAFALEENAPNPFSGTTAIRFALPEAADVRLTVYDALGREVAVLADGRREAGAHTVTFDARALPAGVYLYRLTAGERVEVRRMTIVR
jgi:hypothetical protein